MEWKVFAKVLEDNAKIYGFRVDCVSEGVEAVQNKLFVERKR